MQGFNRLIDALTPALRQQLLSTGRMVELARGQVLNHSQEPQNNIYFLHSGVASFVVSSKEGGSAEIGMVGNEGMVGNAALLGSYAPVADCLMQAGGHGLRMSVQDLQLLFDSSAELRCLVLQATQQLLLTVSQMAACNRLHNATERLARWLLTAADLSGSEGVLLTQEAVSQMLGTRRTTIAMVSGTLVRGGLIRYQRGRADIIDREGLTSAACDCYRINKRLIDGLYSNPYRRR